MTTMRKEFLLSVRAIANHQRPSLAVAAGLVVTSGAA